MPVVEMSGVLRHIGDNVERLCGLEMRPQGPNQGVIWRLASAARARQGEPAPMLAALRLVAAVKPGDTVIVTTGAGLAPWLPVGETDGPPGAAALAYALSYGLGATPVLVTEAAYVDNLAATCLAIGLGRRDAATARRVPHTCAVLPFPTDETAPEAARALLEELAPAAVMATEKLGPNALGFAHTATGLPAGDGRARVEYLFDLAAEQGRLTIGIGDNGNEIGMGSIVEAVWEHKEWGRVCRCPCGGGVATRVATDVVIVAGTSNWGAYGLEACLFAALGRPDLIHSAEAERRMLTECVRTGAADGSTGRHVPQVDGTPDYVQTGLLDLLRVIVGSGLEAPPNRPF